MAYVHLQREVLLAIHITQGKYIYMEAPMIIYKYIRQGIKRQVQYIRTLLLC